MNTPLNKHYPSVSDFNTDHRNHHKESNSLSLLFEYTKFHIGVYLTMTSAYIGFATLIINNKLEFKIQWAWLSVAVLATMVAGVAGGVIISSVTQLESTKTSDFLCCKIGPWNWKRAHFPAQNWIYLEHTSFWLGLISAILSLLLPQL